MCGLAGLFTARDQHSDPMRERLERMTEQLVHRGPDDDGIWIDEAAGVALGFRRLSILDTSTRGAQPMRSGSNRFVILFNGEIYNFVELAKDLSKAGFRFVSRSDTEVVLAALEHWGVERAVERFAGMFAMAVWDAKLRRLTLLRDRLGIKPLYYVAAHKELLFASEIKALAVDERFDRNLDRRSLAAYLKYLYVPAPRSIFTEVKKLPAGCFLHVEDPVRPLPEPTRYWDLKEAAARGLADPLRGDDADIIDSVADVLREAVRIRLRSDVPLGVLLSGGVDSSTVAALAQSELTRPIKTFSIGFDIGEHDEAGYALDVASHIGSDHVAIQASARTALDLLPRIAHIYDEPLADPSQLPTLLVSELARKEVTVALSGDGGDELFSGYNRYNVGARLIPVLQRTPRFLRRGAGALINAATPARWDRLSAGVAKGAAPRLAGEKAMKLSRLMRCDTPWEMYQSLLGVGWDNPADAMLGGFDPIDDVHAAFDDAPVSSLFERMMYVDQRTYLPDDLLAKVDRASMAVSLEVRVPILDHRVVEASWRLPAMYKVRDGVGKWTLRQVLYRYVPRRLVDRPKVGFTPPIAEWLRGDLSTWASDLLSTDRIKAQGIFEPKTLSSAWNLFISGRSDLALRIWAAVQFQAWLEQYA